MVSGIIACDGYERTNVACSMLEVPTFTKRQRNGPRKIPNTGRNFYCYLKCTTSTLAIDHGFFIFVLNQLESQPHSLGISCSFAHSKVGGSKTLGMRLREKPSPYRGSSPSEPRPRLVTRPQLFEGWIALSTGKITTYWIIPLVLTVFTRWTALSSFYKTGTRTRMVDRFLGIFPFPDMSRGRKLVK